MELVNLTDKDLKVVALLFDAGILFVPVFFGYVFAYCGAIGFVWKENRNLINPNFYKKAAISVIFSIFALGLWCVVFAFCIIAVDSDSELMLTYGRWSGRIGLLAFFMSIIFGALSILPIIRNTNRKSD